MSPPPDALPSGPWQGWYRLPSPYDKTEHPMRFVLAVSGETVTGTGTDSVGPFRMQGTYRQGQCDWTKTYVGRHSVYYSGFWNGFSVDGEWTIPGNWSGTFRVWPEG